jgi:hypothetical protein
VQPEFPVDENSSRSGSVIPTDAFAIIVAPFMSRRLLVFPPLKLPLAKARGFGACRTALRDSRRCQVGNGYSIPGLARAFSTVIRATRSDAKSDVGKGKAPPSGRFKSVRCRTPDCWPAWTDP